MKNTNKNIANDRNQPNWGHGREIRQTKCPVVPIHAFVSHLTLWNSIGIFAIRFQRKWKTNALKCITRNGDPLNLCTHTVCIASIDLCTTRMCVNNSFWAVNFAVDAMSFICVCVCFLLWVRAAIFSDASFSRVHSHSHMNWNITDRQFEHILNYCNHQK